MPLFLNLLFMARSCLVFSRRITPRLTYTFDFLLSHCFDQPVVYTQQPQDLRSSSAICINYSDDATLPGDLHLLPAGLLSAADLSASPPSIDHRSAITGFYPVAENKSDWSFDLASATFYLLSRYEEYQSFSADTHGRFPASASLLARHQLLHRPIINEWIQALRAFFRQRNIPLTAAEPTYRLLPTYDIDLAWAFRHRPWWRQLAALTRDSFQWNWQGLQDRLEVLTGRTADPYYTFAWLHQLHQQYQLPAVYFWLLGRYGRYDRNVPPTHPAFRKLFRRTCDYATCGLHPSYAAHDRPERLKEEVATFTSLAGSSPVFSRQHFLRLRFPDTYHNLLRAGIQHDYTLGYPEQPGFRAGYGGTFPWYDLKAERQTDLLLTPFTVMDGTLFRYMGLTAKEALSLLRDLVTHCRKSQTPLVTLWHNSSFYEREGWAGMRDLYQSFLESGRLREGEKE